MENIDWGNLGFSYMKADYNLRCYYRDGKWEEMTLSQDEHIPMHIAATCLHYGQEAFEGLKAYRGVDGEIRLFRADENAKRLKSSADYLMMQAPSVDMFVDAVTKVVKANERFIPPYGTGASLYIRPLLIGTGAQVGVSPSDEYLFVIFVTPVGPYYKSGFNPMKVIVDRDHDRAAPLGTGHVKTGGNYVASLLSASWGHDMGYSSVIYLDAKEKRYIDECGAANFFGIKNGTYVTPKSHSVLPSITNLSLTQLAEDLGLTVERREVDLAELATFEEAGSCGTAAVISPIGSVYDPKEDITYSFGDSVGKVTTELYNRLCGIQYGEVEDTHNWVTIVK